ncbi:tetratricopeptide repeat protein [Rhizobium sp. SAFR-030]|uniref:tetratricopeptide repeat protein n=1 Tax=Rhizobium sp. SAFR-030 TaxID=3387277 RepID=UPI003F7DC76F
MVAPGVVMGVTMMGSTLASTLIAALLATDPGPAQITWEWFNAAETYRNYKVKGRDDLAIAARYFRRAAEHGNPAAAYKLGEAYEAGSGVPKDLSKALYWYREAAARRDRYAQLRIGWFYQNGLVVEPDGAMAASWYEKAASQNNIWGYHMLAVLYAEGEGVPRDLEKAKRYFELSLPETGDGWAMWRLSQIVKPTDARRAARLLSQAAEAGNAQAQAELRRLPAAKPVSR